MYLRTLYLSRFKSHTEARFAFSRGANCLLGPNGAGKTNVLDAIHYLSFTKSAFRAGDAGALQHGAEAFSIKGDIACNDAIDEVWCTYGVRTRKRIRVNGKEPARMADHIGRYPLALMHPHDTEIVGGGGRVRRRFIDALIAQVDASYLSDLIAYNAHLKQRNSLLKSFSETSVDVDLLAVYEQRMAASGAAICDTRRAFTECFLPLLAHRYALLAGDGAEQVGIAYRADCEGPDIGARLLASRGKDFLLQRTMTGPHRDDFFFQLNGHPLRHTASQGQQKSFLISLKMAAMQYIATKTGHAPLLLLDDIFDTLDDARIDRLLTQVAEGLSEQFFITDAKAERCRSVLAQKHIEASFFTLEKP